MGAAAAFAEGLQLLEGLAPGVAANNNIAPAAGPAAGLAFLAMKTSLDIYFAQVDALGRDMFAEQDANANAIAKAAARPAAGGSGNGNEPPDDDNCPHKNSKSSKAPNHRYEIRDKSGDVVKTGISGRSLNANGTSPRANAQVNSLNASEGPGSYSARVVETNIPGRAAALQAEQAATNQLAAEGNSLRLQRLPLPE